MSSFREDPSKLHLCEVCSEIDFEHIAPAVQVCNKTRSEESSFSQHNRNLGTVQEILSPRDRCSFCAATSRHCKGFIGQCELVCEVDFCISSDQTLLRSDGPHTHTSIHTQAYTHKHTHTSIHTQAYTHNESSSSNFS
jgi:hypothetical protein